MNTININSGDLIEDITSYMTRKLSNFKNRFNEPVSIKTSLSDLKRTFEITSSERKGAYWSDFMKVFKNTYEKFNTDMDFNAPGCSNLKHENDTSVTFLYNGVPYLLFLTREKNKPESISLSLTAHTYSTEGSLELKKYLKSN